MAAELAAARVLAEAARAVSAVVDRGRSATDALGSAEAGGPTALRPAVRAVALGTLRWYLRLRVVATALLAGRSVTPALSALLVAALHQLEYSHNPPQAVVSSAVDAARLLRQPRATGLVNALLRRYLREREALLSAALADPVAASAHPAWLLSALRADWPEHWRQIVEAANVPPPLTLRIDLSRCALEPYRAQLLEHDLPAVPVPDLPTALVLERAVPVEVLPGFAQGIVSVQDAGAQLACRLLDVQPAERVLDACAAPGGKTGALLEAAPVELTALDSDAVRLERVADNLRRLQRQARLVVADLAQDTSWWDGRPFDRILLDAPCSGLGVIRRHPDIRLLRRPRDIAALAGLQRRLLRQALGLLRPGGRLLYSTCSVLREENECVVRAVLAAVPAARSLPRSALPAGLPPDALDCDPGVQLLPGNAALADGFYYACLTVTT